MQSLSSRPKKTKTALIPIITHRTVSTLLYPFTLELSTCTCTSAVKSFLKNAVASSQVLAQGKFYRGSSAILLNEGRQVEGSVGGMRYTSPATTGGLGSTFSATILCA